jgi:hypothetical protein
LAAGAVEELTEAAEQERSAQPEEAGDQLGEDRTKGGRNAEDKSKPYGDINDSRAQHAVPPEPDRW